jgi:hypothetical protein
MNVHEIIQHRTVERDERLKTLLPKREVKRHPRGGWTVAVTPPGAIFAVYEGNHSSKAVMERLAESQRASDLAAARASAATRQQSAA